MKKSTRPLPARGGYRPNATVRLVRAGHEYFNLLDKLIHEAHDSIHLQTYIFEPDETGTRVAKALIQAAKRGVKVYVIVDGYASQKLSKDFIRVLREAGIYFRFFAAYFKSKHFYFGRRLHHKVFVVDGRYSLVGGINIGNHYNDTAHNVAWIDWAVYCDGDISARLRKICEARVQGKGRRSFVRHTMLEIQQKNKPVILARPRINDWVRRKREITKSYLEMFRHAEDSIYMMSSYFLPGNLLLKNIAAAAKRGVKIKVIVAGISDVALAKYAERYMYGWFLRHGVEIWEYQRKVLHAKLSTYDGQWVTIGSYNINNISAYASVELNIDIYNEGFARDVERRLKRIMELECVQITPELYTKKQTLWERFLQRSAYDIFRILLFLFTFYFKQRD
ncbi:MAG: hypothetical protein KF725_05850 [Cyclobacteriaceae bacterium]|nr:hypothetical protein [Cyclobacteriaceae bacterium]UYN85221.1 MAG: hypothetical protein KIT51_09960 [Cyclobacteriaceae bacterium]